MSGCYGSDPEDQHFENKLLEHTDPEVECPDCGSIQYEKCSINAGLIIFCFNCGHEEYL